jgi:hypothetical protein
LDSLSEIFLPILLTNSKYLKQFLDITYLHPFPFTIFDPPIPSYGNVPIKKNCYALFGGLNELYPEVKKTFFGEKLSFDKAEKFEIYCSPFKLPKDVYDPYMITVIEAIQKISSNEVIITKQIRSIINYAWIATKSGLYAVGLLYFVFLLTVSIHADGLNNILEKNLNEILIFVFNLIFFLLEMIQFISSRSKNVAYFEN